MLGHPSLKALSIIGKLSALVKLVFRFDGQLRELSAKEFADARFATKQSSDCIWEFETYELVGMYKYT